MKCKFKEWSCVAIAGAYGNGNKAIQLIDPEDGEMVATASVNLIEEKIDSDVMFIKNYSENEGMAGDLINANIIYPEPIHSVKAGFVTVLAYRLTPQALREIFKED